MANTVITPNMGLILPVPGQDPGPDWANNQYASGFIIDEHNHSNGQGVQINPSGLNINSDLPINSNNLTLVNSVEFNNLSAPLAGSAPFLTTIYVANGELYYNDASGNQVKITDSGSVNATSSGISSGTATASFSGGVLVVDANVNTPANIQGASILIGNNVANSNYATLQAPSSLGANYSLTLPPTNTSGGSAFLIYDASNNMGVGPALAGGITGSNIANQTITQGLLAPRPSGSTVSAGGFAVSSSCGSFITSFGSGTTPITNFSVTITTTGRPVKVGFQYDNNGSSPAQMGSSGSTASSADFVILNNATIILAERVNTNAGGSAIVPTSSFSINDLTINGTPGTYTYTATANCVSGSAAFVSNAVLYAYEI